MNESLFTSFSARTADGAIRRGRALQGIAAEYEESPKMVMNWKKRLQARVDGLFQDHRIKRKGESTKKSE